jgi:hypothetical protein
MIELATTRPAPAPCLSVLTSMCPRTGTVTQSGSPFHPVPAGRRPRQLAARRRNADPPSPVKVRAFFFHCTAGGPYKAKLVGRDENKDLAMGCARPPQAVDRRAQDRVYHEGGHPGSEAAMKT